MKHLKKVILVLAIVIGFGWYWRAQNAHTPTVDDGLVTTSSAPAHEPILDDSPAEDELEPPVEIAKPTHDEPNQKASEASQAGEVSNEVAEFNKLAQSVFEKLPTKEQLQQASAEESHHSTERLMQAGEELGRIAELIEVHPELNAEAIKFYEKCSLNGEFPSSVRAVCYSHIKMLNAEKAESLPVSNKIKQLGDQI